ncbi:hypothetical protein [Lacipirellula limnantheis]|uniref:hypothetical protein n=1 Tax=Lacipirellula limnantheis TaxID=2528024 RepID=UPI0011A68163|nr:hypothetical protein [Lacipirellula limnantheis]
MSLYFESHGYYWRLREGFAPMGSGEQQSPLFIDQLRQSVPWLRKASVHEMGSWIVARLNYLTCGNLKMLGDSFGHDTNEFGYKVRCMNEQSIRQASGAVVIHADQVHFKYADSIIDDYQSLFARILADNPRDLDKISIRVRIPSEDNIQPRYRAYGWDGFSLLS